MAEISAQLVKQLRERTGAGMMECKSALTEAKGDLAEAEVVLRKRGIASAAKKATRATKQGMIGTYIHPGSQLGVLIEVNCESDFVARTDEFKELVNDSAMQVAAADPEFVRREDVTPRAARERERHRARAGAGRRQAGEDSRQDRRRPAGKVLRGRLPHEQPFIKENTLTIADVIKTKIAKLGENISVARFVRFKLGDTAAAEETAARVTQVGAADDQMSAD